MNLYCKESRLHVVMLLEKAENKRKLSTDVPQIKTAKDVRRQTGTICYKAGSVPHRH